MGIVQQTPKIIDESLGHEHLTDRAFGGIHDHVR